MAMVAETISFVVYGVPVPQGSTRAFIPKGWNRAIITADNKKTKPWRQEISGMAKDIMTKKRQIVLARDTAVCVSCLFFFPRPKSLKKSVLQKTTKPDIDKLARSVLDALTGIVFEDDSQVVDLVLTKKFSETPCVHITVSPVEGIRQ